MREAGAGPLDLRDPRAGPKRAVSLRARRAPLAAPREQLRALAEAQLPAPAGSADFDEVLAAHGLAALRAGPLEVLQINLGALCNMACRHCHVDAGPDRTEAVMSDAIVAATLRAIDVGGAATVDITGGAPELHPRFRDIVEHAVARGKHVIDRCNLTILTVARFADLPRWLAARGVEIVASLPHYRRRNTDVQRGDETFARSITALRRLNRAGYGQGDPRRTLTLMSNPAGAFLGGSQAAMEREWQEKLWVEHRVVFDRLLVLNNMPIARFLEWLIETGNLARYLQRLLDAFNPAAVAGLMCRNTVSFSWDGRVFDCDFNQMLGLEAAPADGDADARAFAPERYLGRRVRTGRHCFGCTAGAGSSCGGATV